MNAGSGNCFISLFILGGIVIVLVLVLRDGQEKRAKKIKDAKTQYQLSLSKLKESPDDTDLRQGTLKLGRSYADLARGNKRYTFDEVALMNDLNAISTTRSKIVFEVEGVTDNTKESVDNSEEPNGNIAELTDNTEERLTRLKQLHSKGLITDEEYNERRLAILDEI